MGLCIASTLAGCSLWDDYGDELPFDDPGQFRCPIDAPGAETLELEGGSVSVASSACPDRARVWRLDLAAGMRLDARISGIVDDAIVSIELYEAGADSSADPPVEWPVWADHSVGLETLITKTATYELVIRTDRATPAELDVAVKAPLGQVYWIDAGASENGDGSLDMPWNDWTTALSALEPGDLLVARPGSWTSRSSCDGLAAPCRAEAELAQIDCDGAHRSGELDLPITIAAERERHTTLASAGRGALEINNCEHWEVDGLSLEGADNEAERGSGVIGLGDSASIELRRLLVRHANRWHNRALVSIHASSDVAVVESELYDFHRHGIVITDASDIDIQRVYINSRGEPDLPGTPASWVEDTSRGDNAVLIWRGERVRLINTIAENIDSAYTLLGNGASDAGISVGDNSLFWGTIARDTRYGFDIASLAERCSTPDAPDCVASANRIEHCVSLENQHGFRIAGGIDNSIVSSSAFHSGDSGGDDESNDAFGFMLREAPALEAVDAPSRNLRIERSSSHYNADARGFWVSADDGSWTIEYVNAFGHDTPFMMDPLPTTATTEDPGLGGCIVYVPTSSPLSDVGGAPIGANIIYRHNGRAPTDEKVWDQRDGRFACGAVVEGINDRAGASCENVHRRLAVGAEGCPVP